MPTNATGPADGDAAILVLVRATIRNADSVTPDSTIIKAACGHNAFISADGLAFYQDDPRGHGAYAVCYDCAGPDMVTGNTTPKYGVPGAIESAKRHLGVGQADQMEAWMRDLGIRELDR